MIKFGIIGSGWRSEFYLRIAALMPEKFEVSGIYIRNPQKKEAFAQKYNVNICDSLEQLLDTCPEFVVCCVYNIDMCDMTQMLCDSNIAVLCETPIGTTKEQVDNFKGKIKPTWKAQVAEQYHLQPYFQAVKSVIDSGILGEINQVQLSFCHDYHAASVIRFLLDTKHALPTVTSVNLTDSVYRYNSREGVIPPTLIPADQQIAILNYGNKTAVYDFNGEQYFSDIRVSRIVVKGTKGEIFNNTCTYLDGTTAIKFDLQRDFRGGIGNIDGFYLDSILGNGNILYKNPFALSRLSDEEIAVASCLSKMDEYLKTGKDFYSLCDAICDTETSLLWR